ncbi:MAG: YARHG domain-containing protein [Thiotrichaceae bacterium]|nr:YARHG domain-containing protein [Thiotrichaceae bacterium]
MKYFLIFYVMTLSFSHITTAATLFEVDDDFFDSTRKHKGITVQIPVSNYYPSNEHSALYKVLKQAQTLTANISFLSNDGIPYKQHSWNAKDDAANLKRGIDCSRAIWFAFTRAGIPYNRNNIYLDTSRMWKETSQMKHYFHSCSVDNLQLGDVLVYRGKGGGHTVMVLDPEKELAWGSHGYDKSRNKDTGVEVQKVIPAGHNWKYWDRYTMKLKACWRHKQFTQEFVPIQTFPSTNNRNRVGIFPQTYLRSLNHADLQDKTRYMLWIMRNEMFARHGYNFKNKRLAQYFREKSWYKPTTLNSNDIYHFYFSKLEQKNLQVIYHYEQDRTFAPQLINNRLSNTSNQIVGDYPETSKRRLTNADIVGKSQRELSIMRNEVYARYGYRFSNYSLLTYFAKKSWYKPTTTDSLNLYNNYFTLTEQYNVNFIKNNE